VDRRCANPRRRLAASTQELHAHLNGSLSQRTLRELLVLQQSTLALADLEQATQAVLNPAKTFEECGIAIPARAS
jgi:hypothetical protein